MKNVSQFSRRQFLKTAGAAAVAATLTPRRSFGAAPAVVSPSGKKPNILMVVADDQRFDTIAALGNKIISTPNLDRLTNGGFSFNRARCMSGQSEAVCVPSRAQLHTGRTVFHVPMDIGEFQTIGQTMMAGGYNCYGGGKWHNKEASYSKSFHSGRNVYFKGMTSNQFNVPVQDFDHGVLGPEKQDTNHEFSSNLFTDPAVDFLQNQKGNTPFFCYLAFTSPHDPRTPPPPYNTMYDPAKMPLPDNWLPEHPFDNGEMKVRDERLAPFPRTPDNTKKQLCEYYGMISAQDAQLGRMLDALEKTGQLDNTIVVYTGDHGLSIGSHGLFGKQNCYEEAHRIPMLLMGPGIPKGERSDAMVYGLDLFPTLCELTGAAVPETVEGKSFGSIMNGNAKSTRDWTYSVYSHAGKAPNTTNQQGITDGRWKYIRYFVKGNTRVQLFDLQNDPSEIHDISKDSAAASDLSRMADLFKHAQGELTTPKNLG